jgi:hypothetical protein
MLPEDVMLSRERRSRARWWKNSRMWITRGWLLLPWLPEDEIGGEQG